MTSPYDPSSRRTVVLDGSDGVGKTTMANDLSARHGFTVVHSLRTPDHQDLTDRYRTLLNQPGRLILDRCFLSELVYGPLTRGVSRLSWAQALDLAEAVTARDGLFVHLTATPDVIHQRLLHRDGEAPDVDQITELVTGYTRVFEALNAYSPVLTIDTSTSAPLLTGENS
ncbi:hypothetical protein [Streptomyces sp. NPDC020667]|uniref:AAA family ATPase n=1 Tax=Streptomyces sp. NPDC020667 TaxID=3154895 RepID=UPI0033D99B16